MSNRSSRLLVATLLVAAVVGMSIAPTVIAQQQEAGEKTVGEPDLEVLLSENEVTPGEAGLEIAVLNDGDLDEGMQENRVMTARSVTATISDDGPFDAKTNEVALGTIPDGQQASATAPLRIEVPEGIEPGEYDITVKLSYSATTMVRDDGLNNRVERMSFTEEQDLTLVVPDEPRFEATTVDAAVEPGASGTATIEVTNVGTEPANETRATVTGFGGVTIDGGSAEELLGDLAVNESKTFTVDAAVAESTSDGNKPIEVALTYRDETGTQREAKPETASLTPAAEQSFSIASLEDTLSVGYEGDITGKITNDGPRAIDDAVLIVEPMSESLYIEDTRYALPSLKAGETVQFRYPTDVSGQADPGPRQLRFTVEYTGTNGDATLTDGPMTDRVVVDERQDEFSIDDDGVTVQQGKTTEFALTITNDRDQTLSNIDARLYADSPLSTTNDEAFVPELEPGESTEITFDISAEAAAATETHPVELDFEYENERGESKLSDTYQHPIEVVPSESDGGGGFMGSLVTVMLGLTIVGLGGVAWWRRT